MGPKPYSVLDNVREGHYSLITLSGEVSPSQPGQFYMVRGDWGADPLLPRPMSVLADDPGRGAVKFLLKVVGEGTRLFSEMKPGARVLGFGPLGRPFPTEGLDPRREVALIGGGVGVPPLAFLAERLRERGIPLTFYQGARARADLLLLDVLETLGVHPVVTTEDGSEGGKGLVTAPFSGELARYQAVYACGPEGMLKAVAGLCRGRVPAHLSLEARMACGYGVCLGCVVPVLDAGRRAYKRVCKEGPVFLAEEVLWE